MSESTIRRVLNALAPQYFGISSHTLAAQLKLPESYVLYVLLKSNRACKINGLWFPC